MSKHEINLFSSQEKKKVYLLREQKRKREDIDILDGS